MIRRAVERGVPPERLAKALSVDVSQITKKVNLLDGICPEAIELFKDRQFSVELGRVIRKMKPTRQVECAELMVAANNMTVAYAEAQWVRHPASRSSKAFGLERSLASSPIRWRAWNARWPTCKVNTGSSSIPMGRTYSISCSRAGTSPSF